MNKPKRRKTCEEKTLSIDGFDIDTIIGMLGRMKETIGNKEYTVYLMGDEIVFSIPTLESDESFNKRLKQWQEQEDKRLAQMEKEVLKQKAKRKELYEKLKEEFDAKE